MQQSEKFIPEPDQWVLSHYYQAVDDAAHFCGPIFAGASIVNVGCGEMLTDFGLLRLAPNRITGIDIWPHPADHLEQCAARLAANGIAVPDDYRQKLDYICYDGEHFPFDDGQVDVIFSWSAFEHIANVPQVLGEIHRVLKPGAHAFIQVFPWFACFHGSHLSDWLDEPFFHLRRSDDWVHQALVERAESRPDQRDFILHHMLPEYKSLNKWSARRFYDEARRCRFDVIKAKLIAYEQDLSQAPDDIDFADLMISGTMMLLRKPGRDQPAIRP